MAFSIDKGGVVPRYFQLKEMLKRRIADGTLTGKIPSERELAGRYGIAHMTVRRAVSELVEEGYLYRATGRGTFVSSASSPARRTQNIAFVLPPEILDAAFNPYFSILLRGVQEACAARGYNVIYCGHADDVLPLDAAGAAGEHSRKVDGIIAVAAVDTESVRRAARFVPAVTLDVEIEGLASVLPDNFGGSALATRHLIGLGHARIGHVSGNVSSVVGLERFRGYRAALEEAGIAFDPGIVRGDNFTFDRGYRHVGAIMSAAEPPTGLVCANDALALGAMKRLDELGVGVPDDVSVVGFDDTEPCLQARPPLTTVATPKEEIARIATEKVIAAIGGADAPLSAERTVLATRLVERESCAPPRGRPAAAGPGGEA